MAIIQVRGTSGSGKTTAMRAVMKSLGEWKPHYVEGRKQPLYYSHGKVLVLGHYEIACGGGDTIGSVPQIFAALKQLPPHDFVLCEGLLLSEDVIWLQKERDARVLFLTTEPEECLRRVEQRQNEKGRKAADPARVRRKLMTRVGTIERARRRLVNCGILCRRCSTEQASKIILDWLKGK